MPFGPGARLGPYEIQSALGAGGMGEVYKATDTNLKRAVAIKMLPASVAADADRLVRFQREAEVLAALNHPHIAAIYGLERSSATTALVMELVEGPTLADRIADGPIPVDEAVVIATQIAEALEAAHEQGIIHRDLKPSNIKVRPDGTVKVLDFGLAKALEPIGVASPGTSQSPTITTPAMTARGVILGTAAYMSPEQARGRPVDKRTDIWAFGCVLYEMLTGKRAFSGEDSQETIANILKGEPVWEVLPETTPPGVRALLRRCLQKDAKNRLRDAGDVRIQLLDAVSVLPAHTSDSVPAARTWPRMLYVVLTVAVVAIIGGAAVWALRPSPVAAPRPVERLTIDLASDVVLAAGPFQSVAFSAEGSHLVYAAGIGAARQLYLRPVDALEARPLSGTDGAQSPFFSPDGQWIGFFTPGTLRKVSITGGAVLTLNSAAVSFLGGTWGSDDIVVASGTGTPLSRVSAAGGALQEFTTLQRGEVGHRWPQFLPDGKTLLFTVTTSFSADDRQIALLRAGATEHEILIRGGTYGRYVPTGHLVYYRAGTIMAVPFDPDRLQVRGSPVPVQAGVRSSVGNAGAAQFSFSERGTLVYAPGDSQQNEFTTVWVDRNGREQGAPLDSRVNNSVRLSPDGQRAALVLENDIWTYDVSRGTLSRLTFEGVNTGPTWSPDSRRIVFRSSRGGAAENIYWKPADGTGQEERLSESKNMQRPNSFTPDGKTLMYAEVNPKGGIELWVLPLDGERKARPYLQGPFRQETGRISPDGRWVAYLSDESGRYEIYVRPFPDADGGKWQITTDGAGEISWAPSGKELFYRTGPGREKMMVVDIQTQAGFVAGRPRLLFAAPYFSRVVEGPDYGVSPDGQRFLMIKAPQQEAASSQFSVVLNWFDELKRLVPAAAGR